MSANFRHPHIGFVLICMLIAVCVGGCTGMVSEREETCSKCGSTRSIRNDGFGRTKITITYKSPKYAACSHAWQPGISAGVDHPISDGTIVLVKQGSLLGAFIPKRQSISPETLEYEWYYRRDGKGTFKLGESFHAGHGSGRSVKFGPIKVFWSDNTTGKGWIDYANFPGTPVQPGDVRLCPTSETDITKIDATDKKWCYKGSPSDPGIRADGTACPASP